MLVLRLCEWLRDELSLAVVTNDIYTREDAEFLVKNQALSPQRIVGVETGGCPHTAIRDDTSMNDAAVAELVRHFPELELILIESGGDNLSATFSPELVDAFIYVIDVAEGDKIPRKGVRPLRTVTCSSSIKFLWLVRGRRPGRNGARCETDPRREAHTFRGPEIRTRQGSSSRLAP